MFRVTAALIAATCAAQNFTDVRPSPQQIEWQDLEIGALFHFGPNTFMDREWGDGTADPKVFNPAEFNAEQWILAVESAGAKYVVMVAKHHDGFCLWPTAATPYSVKNGPWRDGKGDIVREVAAAARKHGLRFGVYLSPWDRHEPSYKNNADYDRFYKRQLTELATRYGELVEFWLDGAGSEGHVYDFDSYVRELRTYQPNTLLFADVGFLKYGDLRWVGNESGVANEENWNVVDRLGYLRYRPAEADTPLRKRHWFWHPNDEKSLKSVDELIETYHQTVGRGAQLMLGLAPDTRGLMPDSDVRRLREFGDAIRALYADNIALDKRHPALDGNPDTFWEAPAGAHAAVIEVRWEQARSFDRTAAMEWMNAGQRIQKYSIEALENNNSWRRIYNGSTIGHKKIDIFEPVTARAVRLNILSASDAPVIREFQVYEGRKPSK
jgi:alpha-L-fucosidase